MKNITILALVTSLLLVILPVGLAFAATTAQVNVTATPGFISITNSPSSYDFGAITANSTDNTTNGYFTITNGSSINTDIFIKCNGWTGGPGWIYGSPAQNQGQLAASSADGNGASGGAGLFDVILLNGTDTLLCDNITSTTDPSWELQLQAPTEFTFGDQQTTTVTLTAAAQ